jgi:hypothetical protein
MSEEGRDGLEIPKGMRSMAEASLDSARKAFEKFVAGAQQTAGSIEERGATVRAGAKDINAKAIALCRKERAGVAGLCAIAAPRQGSDRSHAAAQRICADADAVAGGTGQRDGPDCQPCGDGGRQAEKLRHLNTSARGGLPQTD